MSNTLNSLNDSLFEQLSRLNDANLKGEGLNEEVERAKAIVSVSSQIIQNGNLALQAAKFSAETLGRSKTDVPKMLIGESNG